jgi:16S rRNA (cytidine1402-2'-O)-methyltransferase
MASGASKAGCLYVVATPIGNLEDITLRALRVLRECDVIACEDTRQTQKLLNHYEIRKTVVSCHEHNEQKRTAELLTLMENGSQVALVSDAGTPGISDPGQRLVQSCRERGVVVVPVPGPSAVVTALAASGLDDTYFLFGGFLPQRAGERRRELESLASFAHAMVFYEAPHRLGETLRDALEVLGNRRAFVARELTKLHEELAAGSLAELLAHFERTAPRGEITLVISAQRVVGTLESAAATDSTSLQQRVQQLMQEKDWDEKAALKQAARERGLAKREAYKRLLAEKQQSR